MTLTRRTLTFAIILLFVATSLIAATQMRGRASSNSHRVADAASPEQMVAGEGAGTTSAQGAELASLPETPPDASKLSVGDPNAEGIATVSGEPGAVPGEAYVAVVNLSSRNVAITTAGTNGSFDTSLFAPPGSTLMVKYDLEGWRVEKLWADSHLETAPDLSYMNPLPGTMIMAGSPAPSTGSDVPFLSAGSLGEGKPWGGWWLEGSVTGPGGGNLSVAPGAEVTVQSEVRITSPALSWCGTPDFAPVIHYSLRYLFDAAGNSHPSSIWFTSHLFTPTGLPIEHESGGESVGVATAPFAELACAGNQTLYGTSTISFTVPTALPVGTYRLEGWLDSGGVPLDSDTPVTIIWYHEGSRALLPSLKVGDAAPPRIPWTLFSNYLSNGHRGIPAHEDEGNYAMPTRVVLPPHRVVFPRLDERSGEPLSYRLEPGSQWLSATDRRMPRPPHLPLALPSGELQVTVHKPDGTVDLLGPAPIRQSSVRTPTTPGGSPLQEGTGHIGDLYHLYTGDDAFAYQFEQYGPHTISLHGVVADIYGNEYVIGGTYDVMIARILDLDPAQLPTTPYQQGDAFAPGLHLFPPVPAHVTVRLLQLPNSDPGAAMETIVEGQANRFGIFQPPTGTDIRLEEPGEFRVDIAAEYEDPDGTLWAGYMTWGNVIEGPTARIEAHGRRGMDFHGDLSDPAPIWFKVFDLPADKVGIEVYYPYVSGDIHWGNEDRAPGDSIHSIITVKDKAGLNGPIYGLLRANYPRATTGLRWPPDDMSLTGLEQRLAIGEAPLFTTTSSGMDAAVAPEQIDQWGYAYNSSQRPDVRVREIITEDNMGTAYWRFNDTYAYQIGESAAGDLPGDLKWEFGGAVLRTDEVHEYAIYGSLWVLLPHGCDEYGCARVTPPFQDATGASINGGPIMTLQGEEIDMLFLPKGIRPGDVLEVGDVVAFSGHVGPPLDSRVEVTITAPSGHQVSRTWHANKIGWLYDPTFDFVAEEAGRWTVDVIVEHDRPYAGNGVVPTSHNTGTVLGSGGQFEFYVVPPDSPRLFLVTPEPGFLKWSGNPLQPIQIRGAVPAGTTAVYYTIHDKGVVIEQGSMSPGGNSFTLTYDAMALHELFPFISLTAHEGMWEGLADEVAINLLAVGSSGARAATVTLIGEELFLEAARHQVQLPLVVSR
ncbi:MAG: hypothetical protein RRC07_10105 [Anaerolineae bacterium]|nr:hypothetical protein [Anaerolineae bacterium]